MLEPFAGTIGNRSLEVDEPLVRIRRWAALFGLAAVLLPTGAVRPQAENVPALEHDFRMFFERYRDAIEQRDVAFLRRAHPDLPEDMHDFFLDLTDDMMAYGRRRGIAPTFECEEYEVCKVIFAQPGDTKAWQTFIRHEGMWRWLGS